MCGRYTLSTPGERLAEVFDVRESPVLEPRFNIAPTQRAPVIPSETDPAARRITNLEWGLVPSWRSAPTGRSLINARAETVHEKPAFRESFARRRCLVPADGFYEWQARGGAKQPFFFAREDGEVFAMAGIWSPGKMGEASGATYAILTTEANRTVAEVHHRMPVILDAACWDKWLSADLGADLSELLRPAPDGLLVAYPVSPFVNSPANDSPRCVERVDVPIADLPQGRLF